MPSLPRIRSRRAAPGTPVVEARPGPAELRAGGVTWVHLLAPTTGEAQLLAHRFGWHPLDVEDVLSRRQRPKVDTYEEEGYLVTLPGAELTPLSRLFNRCEEDEGFREQLFAKGSGRLLYEVLDDLFDYCFPILDKIGHKLDALEDDVFEGRSDEVVRDISNVKQEIISYRKIVKPERSTLRVLEA